MTSQRKFNRSILGVALITLILLAVPLVAMQFTDEVDWSAGDFIIMGALIFSTGLSFVLVTRFAPNFIYRAAIGLALGTTFFMVWANLAVGLIGSGPHLGNLMYLGVVAVVIISSSQARFKAAGMQRAMTYSALSLMLLAVIALVARMDEYPGSSVTEILGVNGFFAVLYILAGSFFREAGREPATNNP